MPLLSSRARTLVILLAGAALGAVAAALPRADAKGGDDGTSAIFAPSGNIEPAIVSVIDDAKKDVVVAMYLFTSRPLAEALVRAKARGVDVRVVLDKDQKSQRHGKYGDLKKGGVGVRVMAMGKSSEGVQLRFHHKFVVVDGQTLETGSYNWTTQADEENWENAVIFRSKPLAAQFKAEFEKAWKAAAAEKDDGDDGN
jgi:phosphatidylserine/phosphatidylglycerophosphate/cardiolipin synthase-like enzyme